jgi:hypothetical protein
MRRHTLGRVLAPDGRTVTRPDPMEARGAVFAEWRAAWEEGQREARRVARVAARNAARRLWMDRDCRELTAAGFWGAV